MSDWRDPMNPMTTAQRAEAYIDSATPFNTAMTREERKQIFAEELTAFGYACASAEVELLRQVEAERDRYRAALKIIASSQPQQPDYRLPEREFHRASQRWDFAVIANKALGGGK